MQKATVAKQTSERAEAKEQAQMDIMAYIADKTANHQDASLDDEKVKEILSDNKSYVKNAGDTSFITAKGEYEIPYSELYTAKELSDLDRIKKFLIDHDSEAIDNIEDIEFLAEDEKTMGLIKNDWECVLCYIRYNNKIYRYEVRQAPEGGDESISEVSNVVEVPYLITYDDYGLALINGHKQKVTFDEAYILYNISWDEEWNDDLTGYILSGENNEYSYVDSYIVEEEYGYSNGKIYLFKIVKDNNEIMLTMCAN